MHKLIYTKSFLEDLVTIEQYIGIDNEFYAVKVVKSIFLSIEILKAFPRIGKILEEETRIIIENNYKYKIVYEIYNKNIYILGVYKYKKNWK